MMQSTNPSFAVSLQAEGLPESARAAAASHDFDFLIGNWSVQHRKLKHRLSHSDEWETFSGTCVVTLLLGGFMNVDDNVLNPTEGTYKAASIRAFDSASQKWSIWWLDGRHPTQLDPPVIGEFHDGTGLFLGGDIWNGKPIKVRFKWSNITPISANWEQAFSTDDGKTWETNWTMEFRRTSVSRSKSPVINGMRVRGRDAMW